MKYSYSSNGEDFMAMCASIEEAISEACDDDDMVEVIYVGESKQRTIGEYLNVHHIESLIESLAESAGEECGECAEDWLSPPDVRKKADETKEAYQVRIDAWRKEQAERFDFLLAGFRIVLETWATDRGEQPTFWHVDNVKEYDRDGNLLSGWQPDGRVI